MTWLKGVQHEKISTQESTEYKWCSSSPLVDRYTPVITRLDKLH